MPCEKVHDEQPTMLRIDYCCKPECCREDERTVQQTFAEYMAIARRIKPPEEAQQIHMRVCEKANRALARHMNCHLQREDTRCPLAHPPCSSHPNADYPVVLRSTANPCSSVAPRASTRFNKADAQFPAESLAGPSYSGPLQDKEHMESEFDPQPEARAEEDTMDED